MVQGNHEKNYVIMEIEEEVKDSVLKKMANEMNRFGFVKDTYPQAICDREAIYPTGLPTKGVGVAIPHTDSIHVNEKAIALGILKKPIEFNVLCSEDEFVDVELIFMLAITDPKDQVKMLQRLIELCKDEESLIALKESDDFDEVNKIVEKLLEN